MLLDWRKVKIRPIAASAAVLALVGGIGLWARGAPAEVPLKIEPTPLAKLEPANVPAPSGSRRSMVHIVGAVHRPGVYELDPGSRVNDAVRLAGGPTADAASDRLNLAALVVDGQKIVVPNRNDGAESPDSDPTLDPVPAATEAPVGEIAPAPISGVISGTVAPSASRTARRPRRSRPSSPRRQTAKAPKPTLAPASIALNSATEDDLDRLPGVGPATAQKILEERHRRGGFQSVEELLDVKGIGPAKLAKMRPYLTL